MLCSVQSKDSVRDWKPSCPSSCLPPCLPSLSPLWTLEICCKSMRIIWPRQLAWFALTGDWQKLIKKPLQGVHASCRMPHVVGRQIWPKEEYKCESAACRAFPPEFSNANECWCHCHCVGRPFAWAEARFPLEMDTAHARDARDCRAQKWQAKKGHHNFEGFARNSI